MRLLRLVLLLLIGLAALPACATPACHGRTAAMHHGAAKVPDGHAAPDHGTPAMTACLGCAIPLAPPTVLVALPLPPSPGFAPAVPSALAGIEPRGLSPPPRPTA